MTQSDGTGWVRSMGQIELFNHLLRIIIIIIIIIISYQKSYSWIQIINIKIMITSNTWNYLTVYKQTMA